MIRKAITQSHLVCHLAKKSFMKWAWSVRQVSEVTGQEVIIRSELDQLDKYQKLLDSSVITQDEYDELKGKIDIKELWANSEHYCN